MPREPTRASLGVNVPGLTMAGFQLSLYGRIWVTPEDEQEQEKTNKEGNNPANNPSECSRGARFEMLAHVNGDLQHCV